MSNFDLSSIVDTLIPETGDTKAKPKKQRLTANHLRGKKLAHKFTQDELNNDFNISELGQDSNIEGARFYHIEELIKLVPDNKAKCQRKIPYFKHEELPEYFDEYQSCLGLRRPMFSDNPLSLWYKDEDDEDNRLTSNTRYKAEGVRTLYTQEHLDEWAKCRDDILYFCKYVVITNIDRGNEIISLRSYQQDILNNLSNNRNNILLLPRQVGKTTIAAIHLAHFLCFNDKSVGLIAHIQTGAIEILDRIKQVIEQLPDFLQPTVTKLTEKSVKFSHGAEVHAFSSAVNSMRGRSFSKVFIDELAFIDNASELWSKSIRAVVSSGRSSSVIIASTPNGFGNTFHDLWSKSIAGLTSFKTYTGDWRIVQDRMYNARGKFDDGKEWYNEQVNEIGLGAFEQEHCVSFLSTAKTLIDATVLDNAEILEPVIKELQSDEGYRFHVNVYKEPVLGDKYCIGLDPAEGKGLDYTTLTVVNMSSYPKEVVAIYRSNTIFAHETAMITKTLAEYYKNAWVMIEVNNPSGVTIAEQVYHHQEYTNLYSANKNYQGIKLVRQTKMRGCDLLKFMIENENLKLNDGVLIKELLRFSMIRAQYQAVEGHDDSVMALLVMVFGFNQEQFYDMWEEDQSHLDDDTMIDDTQYAFYHNATESVDRSDLGGEYNWQPLGFGSSNDDDYFEQNDESYGTYGWY